MQMAGRIESRRIRSFPILSTARIADPGVMVSLVRKQKAPTTHGNEANPRRPGGRSGVEACALVVTLGSRGKCFVPLVSLQVHQMPRLRCASTRNHFLCSLNADGTLAVT